MWNVTVILTMTTRTVLENGVAVGVSLSGSGSHLFSAGVPCLKTIASGFCPGLWLLMRSEATLK